MKCSMPASLASSTTYWISGLSTMVSISFGIALVAGRTRVPRPATGKTALRIFMGMSGALNVEEYWLDVARLHPGTKADLWYGSPSFPLLLPCPCAGKRQQQNLPFVKLLETVAR